MIKTAINLTFGISDFKVAFLRSCEARMGTAETTALIRIGPTKSAKGSIVMYHHSVKPIIRGILKMPVTYGMYKTATIKLAMIREMIEAIIKRVHVNFLTIYPYKLRPIICPGTAAIRLGG